MLRRVVQTGLSTCGFALKSVFHQSARRHFVRALGLLLALGCAVVFDGRLRASAQGGGGAPIGGGFRVVGSEPGPVEKLFADPEYCWWIESLDIDKQEWHFHPGTPHRPTSDDHNFNSVSFEGGTITHGGQGQIIITSQSRDDRAVRYPCRPSSRVNYRVQGGERQERPRLFEAPPLPDAVKERQEIGSAQRTWSGGYLGVAFGANWTGGSWITNDVISLGGRDVLVDAIKDLRASNFATDIYFGYYMGLGAPEWLAGLEADIAYYNALMDPGIPGTGAIGSSAVRANDSVNVRARWSIAVRGRLGYLVTPSTQIYIAGGPSWLNMDATVNCTTAGVCGTNGIAAFSQTNSTTKAGWTLGGGVETKMWGHWRARAEYRYADYGTFSTNFGSPAQLAVAAGIKVHTNTVLFGLAYAFGGPDTAPRRTRAIISK